MNTRLVGHGVLSAAVGAALCVAPVSVSAQRATAAQKMPTPRDVMGHPDLNGVWNAPGAGAGGGNTSETGDIEVTLTGRSSAGGVLGQAAVNFEQDNTLLRRMNPNVPLYKPEYWARVQRLDQNGSREDPAYSCLPAGVPRMGPPNKIVVLPTEVVLFYSGARDTYREIATDGRPHTPDKDLEGTWMGEGRGHWDGDTFVIDSTGFTDASWLGIAGWFHSEDMRVIETLRRDGNTLTWQATVLDPDVLLRPFVMNPVRRQLDQNPRAVLTESLPCFEQDLSHLVTNEHH